MKRKIAVILAADIVGYSRLVAEDEEETLRRLMSARRAFSEIISQFRGRIFSTSGDSILAEFPSAVEAARCAVELQQSAEAQNECYSQNRRMEIRIGMTVGDVVEQDGDLFGDGVNIAARLEGIAPPGGIYISNSFYEQVASKLALEFTDLGKRSLKNLPQPVQVYALPLRSAVVSMPSVRAVAATRLRQILPADTWRTAALWLGLSVAVAGAYYWNRHRSVHLVSPASSRVEGNDGVSVLSTPPQTAAPVSISPNPPAPTVKVPVALPPIQTELPARASTPEQMQQVVPRPAGTEAQPAAGFRKPIPAIATDKRAANCSEILERAQMGELTAEDRDILKTKCR